MTKKSRKDQSPEARRARAEAKREIHVPHEVRTRKHKRAPLSPMLIMQAARKLGGPMAKEWTS